MPARRSARFRLKVDAECQRPFRRALLDLSGSLLSVELTVC